MSINTQNVKLGTCNVIYGGVDLGATQGGVTVAVTTTTHQTMIDQFGNVPVKEFITARTCQVTVPMAETTVEMLNRIMPGATLFATGGVKASGTITLGVNPTNLQTIIVNGTTFVFKTVAVGALDVLLGSSAILTAASLAAALSASIDSAVCAASYSVASAVVTVTANDAGVIGNAFTLGAGTSAATLSGATLSAGADATKKKATVGHATGTDLLAIAKVLVLHPVAKPSSDRSEDFVVPLAGTAGAMNFSYKLDAERTFGIVFNAYPDSSTGILFIVGDPSAT